MQLSPETRPVQKKAILAGQREARLKCSWQRTRMSALQFLTLPAPWHMLQLLRYAAKCAKHH
jgi:hypothetical protein